MTLSLQLAFRVKPGERQCTQCTVEEEVNFFIHYECHLNGKAYSGWISSPAPFPHPPFFRAIMNTSGAHKEVPGIGADTSIRVQQI